MLQKFFHESTIVDAAAARSWVENRRGVIFQRYQASNKETDDTR